MDDVEKYGEVIDEIKFGKAIKLGLLSDYKIKIMIINDDQIKELIDRRYWLEVLGRELTADELAKAWALIKSFNQVNHVISFHSRVRGAKEFQINLEKVSEYLREKGRSVKDIKSYHISGKDPAYLRSEILKEFIEDKKSLVTNARCLTEGIDVPTIDGVYFVDPKKNIIDIVQATGRAIRKKKSKYGYVIIPIYLKDTENINDIISSTAFEQVWNVVAAMKDQDERLQHIITELKIFEGKKKFGSLKSRELSEQRKLRSDLANILDLEDSILPKNIDINDFVEKIGVRTLEVIGGSWDERFGEYNAFKERYDLEPSGYVKSENKSEKSIAFWAGGQRRKYKKNELSQDKIDRLNSVDFIWDLKELNWDVGVKEYQIFKEKNNSEPSRSSKNASVKALGRWSEVQRIRYNKKGLSQDKIKKLTALGFIWDLLESYWDQKFKDYNSFKKKYGREPKDNSKDEFEKLIASWGGKQRNSYSKNKLPQDKIDKLNSIGFIWGLQQDWWEKSFKEYKLFSEKYGREPSRRSENERRLTSWATRQRRYYKEKIYITQSRIRKLNSIGFIWDKNIAHRWDSLFKQYNEFKERNNREPSGYAKSENKFEKMLAKWASHQRDNYKNSKLTQDRIKKLNSVDFMWKLSKGR